MVLNYKNIPYKTEWIEYPDLEPKFKALGIPPNPKDAPGYFADYSSPTLRYPDGTFQMDSWPIALELEKRYPEHSLHLDDPLALKIRDHIPEIVSPIVPHLIPKVAHILNKPSQDFFLSTRETMFGKPLAQVEAEGATEECWEKAKAPAKEAGDLLRANGGPFFLGETVSYADFMLVSMLHCARRVNEDVFKRILGLDEAFGRVYEACGPWLERET
jgi:glutathione S-transferase